MSVPKYRRLRFRRGCDAVDHVLHAVGMVIAPVSATPVLSIVEDIGSLMLTLAAFVVPVLAALGVIALAVLILTEWRRRRRRGG